ncbi:hypothetical protein [Curvivirga sp.]|uniref:hypothetical protein n=1 Tax=Curvivirga sp. TaxID=2856848 RepID=UPI003B5CF73C
MPSAKEIKIYAKENNLSNAEARKILLSEEASVIAKPVIEEKAEVTEQQLRELARREGTIGLGLVVEKRGSGKPSKGLPKLNKKSPIFRVDVTLAEIEQLAQAAQMAMPGVMVDDFAYILGDGLKEGAHLENGEQFAAALCGYFVHTEGYHLIKENSGNPDFQGAIIRVISYKDGYVIRPADYIRSYEQVDKSFTEMKIQ